MKRKEIVDLRNKSIQELNKIVDDKRNKLRSLRFDLAAGKVKNVSELVELKKDVARLLTIIKIKENEK